MGTFRYPMEIAAKPEGPFIRVEALVDTGAFYSWVPASTLENLGVRPTFQRQFRTADGRVIERPVAEVVARIDGQVAHTFCVFGDEGTEPLLGAYTLEAFALSPDPVSQRLVPLGPLPLLVIMRGLGLPRG